MPLALAVAFAEEKSDCGEPLKSRQVLTREIQTGEREVRVVRSGNYEQCECRSTRERHIAIYGNVITVAIHNDFSLSILESGSKSAADFRKAAIQPFIQLVNASIERCGLDRTTRAIVLN